MLNADDIEDIITDLSCRNAAGGIYTGSVHEFARAVEKASRAVAFEEAAKLPIQTWAERVFGNEAPHRNTLKRWVMLGKLLPTPVRVGRRYFVDPDARYIDPDAEKIRRLVNGG